MGKEALLLVLLSDTAVVSISIVCQTASLAQLLEDDSIHATTKVFVEQQDGCGLVRIEGTQLVVIHTHIDILGIEGSNPYLVLRRCLLGERSTFRNGSQLLRRLVLLVQNSSELLGAHRTIVEHCVLQAIKTLQQT